MILDICIWFIREHEFTCNSTFGGVTHGIGIDLEWGVGHHLTSKADQDLVSSKVIWDVGHSECAISIVHNVWVGISTVWSLYRKFRQYDLLMQYSFINQIHTSDKTNPRIFSFVKCRYMYMYF